MKQKILSLVLAAVFTLAVIPFNGFYISASGYTGVYVNADSGSDSNDGITEATAVKTISAAIDRVNFLQLKGENRVVTVIACGWNKASLDMSSCTEYYEMITLKCKNPGSTIWTSTNAIKLAGPLNINTIFGYSNGTQTACNIYTYGYELILGEYAKDTKAIEKSVNTKIFTGFDAEHNSLLPDADSGNIEYLKDINLTISTQSVMNLDIMVGNVNYLNYPVH